MISKSKAMKAERLPAKDGLYHVTRYGYNKVFLGVGLSYSEAYDNMIIVMSRYERFRVSPK